MTKRKRNTISINEASRHFSSLEERINQTGEVVITKNDAPMYVMFDIEKMGQEFFIEYEKLKVKYISREIMDEYEGAYQKLSD